MTANNTSQKGRNMYMRFHLAMTRFAEGGLLKFRSLISP